MITQQADSDGSKYAPPSVQEIINREWLAAGMTQQEIDQDEELVDIIDRLAGAGYSQDVIQAVWETDYSTPEDKDASDASIRLYLRLLTMAEEVLQSDDLTVAKILHGLAESYCLRHEYAAAEPLYARTLGTYRRAFGSEHPRTAEAQLDYAKALIALGRSSELSTLRSFVLLKPKTRYIVEKADILEKLKKPKKLEVGFTLDPETVVLDGCVTLKNQDGSQQAQVQVEGRYVEAVVISLSANRSMQGDANGILEPVVCSLSRIDDGTPDGSLIMGYRIFSHGNMIEGECPGCHNKLSCVLCQSPALAQKPVLDTNALGWPSDFFTKVAGSITDDTFQRSPQGECETREEL